MVRKRTRPGVAKRNSKKVYDSDENESDSDLDLNSTPSSPAPKRYGLRQRKQPIFFQDFDYEDEDELDRRGSEDEEYNVQVDLVQSKESSLVHHKNHPNARRSSPRSSVSVSAIEPELAMDDGLIDFEDVIRADVVVNNQRVEFDRVVNRNQNEVNSVLKQQLLQDKPKVKEKGKRGRKPKLLIPHVPASDNGTDVHNSPEEDTNLEVQIDPLNFVQCDTEENNSTVSNGVSSRTLASDPLDETSNVKALQNGSTKIKMGPSYIDSIEKFVPPELDEKEKEVVLSNEYLLGNYFDMSADEFLEKQAQKSEDVEEEEPSVALINFNDDDSSDDDVVIIEKKPEIIVLDDD